MQYKLTVNCPDEPGLVARIIDAASEAGAGGVGNYSRVALIIHGRETWRVEEGAQPFIGQLGQVSVVDSVQIQMECPADRLKDVCGAVGRAHPYDRPVIQVTKLEDVSW